MALKLVEMRNLRVWIVQAIAQKLASFWISVLGRRSKLLRKFENIQWVWTGVDPSVSLDFS